MHQREALSSLTIQKKDSQRKEGPMDQGTRALRKTMDSQRKESSMDQGTRVLPKTIEKTSLKLLPYKEIISLILRILNP